MRISSRLKQLRYVIAIWFLIIVSGFVVNAFTDWGSDLQALYAKVPISSVGSIDDKGIFAGNQTLMSLVGDDPYTIVHTNVANQPSAMELKLKSPERIVGLKIDFSDPASDWDIYGYTDGRRRILMSITGNRTKYVNVLIDGSKAVTSDLYAVRFTRSVSAKGDIGIFRVAAFREDGSKNFVDRLLVRIFAVPRGWLGYITYFLSISYVVVILGMAAYALVGQKLHTIEDIAIVLALGILFVSLYGLFEIFFPWGNFVNVLFVLFILLCTAEVFIKGTYEVGVLFPVLLAFSLYGVILLTYSLAKISAPFDLEGLLDSRFDFTADYTVPYADFESDYMTPYGTAKVFMYHLSDEASISRLLTIYKPSDRTPLMPLFSLPILKLFGDRFLVFLAISIVVCSPMLIGGWLLFSELFGEKVANVGTLFLMVNHWLVFAYSFAQLRLLTLFFLAVYLYFIFKILAGKVGGRTLALTGFFGSMAFLSHPLWFLYSIPISLFILIWSLFLRREFKEVIILLLKINIVPIILLVIWVGWGRLESGHRILMQSVETTNWLKFGDNVSTGSNSSFGTIVWFSNALQSKIANFEGIFLQDPDPTMKRSWGFLRTTLPSAVSWTLVPFTILGTVLLKKRVVPIMIIVFSVIFFTIFVFFSYYVIIGLNWYLIGIIPLLIGVAVFSVTKLNKVLQLGVFLVAILEGLYVNWDYFSINLPVSVGQQISRQVAEGNLLFVVLIRLPYLILVAMMGYLLFFHKAEVDHLRFSKGR